MKAPATTSNVLVVLLLLSTLASSAKAQLLPNNAEVSGFVSATGQVDTYQFNANAGDSLVLRAASTQFQPQLVVSNPAGAQAAAVSVNAADVELTFAATTSGVFTIALSSRLNGGAGAYSLQFVRAPGANELGAFISADARSESISLGDLDSYTFAANIGDRLNLRVASADFQPKFTVYDPLGSVLTSVVVNAADVTAEFAANRTGVFTVVVSARLSGKLGRYSLNYVRAPGANELGLLTDNDARTDTIELGDQDAYTFAANPNERIELRVASPSVQPLLRVYDPTGALLTSVIQNAADVEAAFATNLAGVYTVVVSARLSGGIGAYTLNFAHSPGANELGLLLDADARAAVMDVGDLDSYTFKAQTGERVQLRAASNDFQPQINVYDPSGALRTSVVQNSADVFTEFAATRSGTHTIVVSARLSGGAGNYTFNIAHAPGANELGTLTDAQPRNDTIELGDLDSYTFGATAGRSIQLRATSTELQPQFYVYGPTGSLVSSSAANSGTQSSTFTATASGAYTVVVSSRLSGGAGVYQLSIVGADSLPHSVPLPAWASVFLSAALGLLMLRTRGSAKLG